MSRHNNPLDAEQRHKWMTHVQAIDPDIDPDAMRLMERLRMVSHSLYQLGESSLATSGLSYAKWRILMTLHYEQFHGRDSMSPSEISKRQGTSRNTISGLIRDLEDDALIERKLDKSDRRKFKIMLTPEGKKCVEIHGKRHLETMSNCFTALSPEEQTTMGQLLERIGQSLAETTKEI